MSSKLIKGMLWAKWGRMVVTLLLLSIIDLLLVRDITWTAENICGERFIVNFGLSLLVAGAALFLVRGLRKKHPRLAVVFSVVAGIAYFIQTAYFGVYQKYVGVFDLRFFATDPCMSLSLYWENGAFLRPLLAAAIAVAVLWRAMSWPRHERLWLRYVVGALNIGVFAFLGTNWYSATQFQLAPVAYACSFARALDIRAGKNSDAVINRPALPQRTANDDAPDIVWVIGESLTPSHMGVYGYERNTTPNLSRRLAQGEVVAFRNALAISTRTLSTVPYMLSGLQGIDPYGLIYRTPGIFNYGKSAGYQTALITAQDFQWRNIDRLFVDRDMDHFQQGSDFSADVNVSVGADDQRVLDRGVFPYWGKAAAAHKPILLVTQMSGSHPPFSRQVPTALKQFLPEGGPNSVNAYDNTVWYTDLYLERLIKTVRAQRPAAWVFFTSDHGTHAAGDGIKLSRDLDDSVTRIPLLVFPPSREQMQRIKADPDAPVSQADIFATLLSLMGAQPATPIDGLSLLEPIAADRIRVVSPYMITLHNEPFAALVLPDGKRYIIDFEKNSVILPDGKSVQPYEALDARLREPFERRLQAP
jgi:glucan phosphoethanolaminetransferase (alkaline phosphatase superfamily)